MLKRDWKKIYDELNHDSEKLIDLLIQHKDIDDLRWIDIANIANDLTGNHLSEDSYRKKANKRKSKLNYNIDDSDVIDEISKGRLCSNGMPKDEEREKFTELDYKILDLNVAKWQLSDERVQLNALYRRIAREENLRQMGKEIANTMSNFYQLPEVKHKDLEPSNEEQHEAILQISDWHYGIEINSPYNTYNPEKQQIIPIHNINIKIFFFILLLFFTSSDSPSALSNIATYFILLHLSIIYSDVK